MQFTGERFIPTEQGRIRLEHYHRYAMVVDLVTGKEVLDVASGEGYGSAFMADVARSVIGVDISDEAIQHASSAYKKPNLTFRQGSATDLKFEDASFDVVVSFETIEHLAEQAQMLAEIRRVLRPNGVLIISSPNRPVYSEESGEHNEFHVKELDFNEFDVLLRAQFPTIQYFGQRILMGSVIQPLEGRQESFRAWHDDGTKLAPNTGRLTDPVYFVAVCGVGSVNLPNIDTSVVYPDKLDLVKHYVGFAKWAQMQDQIVSERNMQIVNLNQAVAYRDGQVATLSQAVAESGEQIAGLNQIVGKLNQTMAERDGQLANLNQTVAERDSQVANLNQTVAERDSQIANLNQTVAERASQVASLNRAVAARDSKITNLNNAVAARDGQLVKQSLNNNEIEIELHKFSNPLYLFKSLLLQMHRRLQTSSRLVMEKLVPGRRAKRILAEKIELINCSNAFFPEWYSVQNPDVAAAGVDPLMHYLRNGAAEGRSPNPLFDSRWYFEQNQDVAAAGINPLVHYLSNGAAEGRNPNPLFNSRWYLEQNPDVAAAGINPLVHYLNYGAAEGRNPNPLFDSRWYLEQNPDVAAAGINPLVHYLSNGAAEGRNPNPLFDSRWYLEQNPDVAAAGINPQVHYLSNGAAEGRNPNPLFDSRWYLEQNPDVAAAGINPLVHYLSNGAAEGRNPSPLFDSRWYFEVNTDVAAAGINPLAHFIISGAKEGRQPKPGPLRDSKVLCENLLRKNIRPIEQIRFESFDAPKVSVIIPIFNQISYTLQCLESICRYLPDVAFEVIVVDDCSSDDSAKRLNTIGGLKIITNATNQGFIRSCNIGAKAARGEYLHFLNNDTEVTAGWLDALFRTFHEFPGTGFAGSKLVYPDGSLQEAGGIIWQDGSAWNFGRNQDPQLPVYNYAREVDYCSGASIMVPKALFEELGGFDEHYLPAYCEDSDLALKIRDKGYRVIYQPLSTVVHYEGITSGTDLTQGAKAYQIENTRKLFERWKNRLQTHQPAGLDADNAKDRRATRRVLIIDHCTPTPNQDAGSVTVFNLMLLLREMDFQVTFIPDSNLLFMPEYTTALQRAGIEMLYAPYCISVENHLTDVGDRYDLAFLFRPMVAEFHLKTIRTLCPKAKVLYHTVDVHFLRMMREAELQADNTKLIAAEEMKQREFAAITASDASIVHSTAELELLKPELPDARILVYPLIMNVPGTDKTFSERKDIVFVGGYGHPPNVDAVQYFVSEIMPLLRTRLPGVRFNVVGSNPPAGIQAMAAEDVIITGFVDDLNPLLDKMRVSVAPLRYGAGIKGKVGSAMAVGLPVVATPPAAEGMSLTDGENILVADGAEQLANAIVRLYQDDVFWNKISRNGIEFAENAWGAEAAWTILSGILDELGLNSVRGAKNLTLYMPISSSSPAIQNGKPNVGSPVVNDDYQKKIQEELAIYEKQVNVHDLPEIYHYWSNKYLAPIFLEAGIKSIAEFFSFNLLEAKNRTGSTAANFVSVGAGNCDLEVSVAKNLVEAGFKDFILECLEINPVMLERGKDIAREHGVLDNMRFVEADFNTWVAGKKYDGAMANQSLHHVTNLEHLFDQINTSLLAKGSFVISDMIGRNGHQRWPESLEVVQKFWKELPESYKFNVLLDRLENEYDNWDCSKSGFEGIRAQDVLPLLLERFKCEKFVGFGSAIDIFVDRCFGHNFNPESEWDREFIDRVHAEDEAGIISGNLTPTHLLAVFVHSLHGAPYYSRGVTPVSSVRHP